MDPIKHVRTLIHTHSHTDIHTQTHADTSIDIHTYTHVYIHTPNSALPVASRCSLNTGNKKNPEFGYVLCVSVYMCSW